ncbi:MAG: N-6 DNA methylase [Treponema sp.]|nr:N-6 DNA methylase [Treponema sp.]
MLTKENFADVLVHLGFTEENNIYTKKFENVGCVLKADFANGKLIYPVEKGFAVNDGTTSNFLHDENFVVFECVARLFEKGYRPEHIELEPRWSLGHGGKSGKADICVKNKDGSPYLCIIECKTFGAEYKKELSNMKEDGGQLFSYWEQEKATKWLILYASDFVSDSESENGKIITTISTVNCSDDPNLLELSKDEKNDTKYKLYKDATNAKSLFEAWKETYEQKFLGDIIFNDDTVAYDIGVLPLKKKNLADFTRDAKIVNQFEEILRHNNVSDKENAFNRLIALFIAKLYDEKKKTDDTEVDFQYKSGTDTYQTMQDRLQRLHHDGMKEFMKEEIFYVSDDYVKNVLKTSLGENREQLEKELNDTITKLKFYTNNDFAFKDVHNKTLFYQNGKILVEMVELFQNYKIVDSKNLQLLGDMFEQLLNKGFKQNEGQFFTPVPITSFIWKCLPLEKIIFDGEKNEIRYPKVIDYACGAGHFLTEGFGEINKTIAKLNLKPKSGWERGCIYGIEKDYRLARVSKISLFMHGADEGNIIFGDGLDNHENEITIKNGMFDILVANPPYSVSAFKNHLELKNNDFEILDYISKDGKEIETLFVERIAQLLKPKGIAAVILPSSILSNSSTTYIKAREVILKNFALHSIVQFGSKTFGATGTNTVVLYLEKNDEPPVKSLVAKDSVSAIFSSDDLQIAADKEIFEEYCAHIQVEKDDYKKFLKDAKENADYSAYKNHKYFGMYFSDFVQSQEFKTAQKQDEKLKQNSDSDKSENKKENANANENTRKAFYRFARKTEEDKIYYFALCRNQKVLVVTSPNDNAEQENFLGYSWSNRKGDEGIKPKYEKTEEKCGLLYNIYDEENTVSRYVKDSFLEIYRSEGKLQKYLNVCSLPDMLDFSRTIFDKAIRTNVKSESAETEIKSKFPLVKLGDVAEVKKGKSITSSETKNGNVKVVAGGIDFAYYHNEANRPANIITVSASGANAGFVNFWSEPIFASDCTTVLGKSELETKYIFNFLKANQEKVFELQKGAALPHVYPDDICKLLIPAAYENIQNSIVKECEKIDSECQNAKNEIENCENQIEELFEKSQKNANLNYKLSNKEIFEISIGRRVLSSEINDSFDIPVYSANVFEPFGKINKLLLKDFERPSIIWGIDGDWMVNVIPAGQKFYPTDHCGVLRIKNSQLEEKYVAWVLGKEGKSAAFRREYRASIDRVESLSIKLPSLADQKKIVAKISELEQKISAAKAVIASCPARKSAVLKSWLE